MDESLFIRLFRPGTSTSDFKITDEYILLSDKSNLRATAKKRVELFQMYVIIKERG